MLEGLDESFDNVFYNIKGKKIFERIILKDAKALLLSHKGRI